MPGGRPGPFKHKLPRRDEVGGRQRGKKSQADSYEYRAEWNVRSLDTSGRPAIVSSRPEVVQPHARPLRDSESHAPRSRQEVPPSARTSGAQHACKPDGHAVPTRARAATQDLQTNGASRACKTAPLDASTCPTRHPRDARTIARTSHREETSREVDGQGLGVRPTPVSTTVHLPPSPSPSSTRYAPSTSPSPRPPSARTPSFDAPASSLHPRPSAAALPLLPPAFAAHPSPPSISGFPSREESAALVRAHHARETAAAERAAFAQRYGKDTPSIPLLGNPSFDLVPSHSLYAPAPSRLDLSTSIHTPPAGNLQHEYRAVRTLRSLGTSGCPAVDGPRPEVEQRPVQSLHNGKLNASTPTPRLRQEAPPTARTIDVRRVCKSYEQAAPTRARASTDKAPQDSQTNARAPSARKSAELTLLELFEMGIEAARRSLARTSSREGPSKSPRGTTRTEIERGRGDSRVAETLVSRSIPLPSPSAPLHTRYAPPSSSNASTASQTRAYSLARPPAPFTRGGLASPITPSPATPTGHVPSSASTLSQHALSTSSSTAHTDGRQDKYQAVWNVRALGTHPAVSVPSLEVEPFRDGEAVPPTRASKSRKEVPSAARTDDLRPTGSSAGLIQRARAELYGVHAPRIPTAISYELKSGGPLSRSREVEGRVGWTTINEPAPSRCARPVPSVIPPLFDALPSSSPHPSTACSGSPSPVSSAGTPPSLSRLDHSATSKVLPVDDLLDKYQAVWNVRAPGTAASSTSENEQATPTHTLRLEKASPDATTESTLASASVPPLSPSIPLRSHSALPSVLDAPLSHSPASIHPPSLYLLALSDQPHSPTSVCPPPSDTLSRSGHPTSSSIALAGRSQDDPWTVWNVRSSKGIITASSPAVNIAASPALEGKRTESPLDLCSTPCSNSRAASSRSLDTPTLSTRTPHPDSVDTTLKGNLQDEYRTTRNCRASGGSSAASNPSVSTVASSTLNEAELTSLVRLSTHAEAVHPGAKTSSDEPGSGGQTSSSSPGRQDSRREGRVRATQVSTSGGQHPPSVPPRPRPRAMSLPSLDTPTVSPPPSSSSHHLRSTLPASLAPPSSASSYTLSSAPSSGTPSSPPRLRHSTTSETFGTDDLLSKYQTVWTLRAPGAAASSTYEEERVKPTRVSEPRKEVPTVARTDGSPPTCTPVGQAKHTRAEPYGGNTQRSPTADRKTNEGRNESSRLRSRATFPDSLDASKASLRPLPLAPVCQTGGSARRSDTTTTSPRPRLDSPVSSSDYSAPTSTIDRSTIHETPHPDDLLKEYWAVWKVRAPSNDPSASDTAVKTTASIEDHSTSTSLVSSRKDDLLDKRREGRAGSIPASTPVDQHPPSSRTPSFNESAIVHLTREPPSVRLSPLDEPASPRCARPALSALPPSLDAHTPPSPSSLDEPAFSRNVRSHAPDSIPRLSPSPGASPPHSLPGRSTVAKTDCADDLQGEYRAVWNVRAPGNLPTLVAATREVDQQPARPPRDDESSESAHLLKRAGEAPASAKASQHGLASGGPPSKTTPPTHSGHPFALGAYHTESPRDEHEAVRNHRAPGSDSTVAEPSPAPDTSASPLSEYWAAWIRRVPSTTTSPTWEAEHPRSKVEATSATQTDSALHANETVSQVTPRRAEAREDEPELPKESLQGEYRAAWNVRAPGSDPAAGPGEQARACRLQDSDAWTPTRALKLEEETSNHTDTSRHELVCGGQSGKKETGERDRNEERTDTTSVSTLTHHAPSTPPPPSVRKARSPPISPHPRPARSPSLDTPASTHAGGETLRTGDAWDKDGAAQTSHALHAHKATSTVDPTHSKANKDVAPSEYGTVRNVRAPGTAASPTSEAERPYLQEGRDTEIAPAVLTSSALHTRRAYDQAAPPRTGVLGWEVDGQQGRAEMTLHVSSPAPPLPPCTPSTFPLCDVPLASQPSRRAPSSVTPPPSSSRSGHSATPKDPCLDVSLSEYWAAWTLRAPGTIASPTSKVGRPQGHVGRDTEVTPAVQTSVSTDTPTSPPGAHPLVSQLLRSTRSSSSSTQASSPVSPLPPSRLSISKARKTNLADDPSDDSESWTVRSDVRTSSIYCPSVSDPAPPPPQVFECSGRLLRPCSPSTLPRPVHEPALGVDSAFLNHDCGVPSSSITSTNTSSCLAPTPVLDLSARLPSSGTFAPSRPRHSPLSSTSASSPTSQPSHYASLPSRGASSSDTPMHPPSFGVHTSSLDSSASTHDRCEDSNSSVRAALTTSGTLCVDTSLSSISPFSNSSTPEGSGRTIRPCSPLARSVHAAALDEDSVPLDLDRHVPPNSAPSPSAFDNEDVWNVRTPRSLPSLSSAPARYEPISFSPLYRAHREAQERVVYDKSPAALAALVHARWQIEEAIRVSDAYDEECLHNRGR
ncbi:uncharacterized protein B0H18DRAFT_1110628 [Fomitopsis serialis]|uniref:uncharacterized protein n=1 Tax=Fomitopsis serialis TaxID=139415 RepID=UPI0020073A34|nr:uncharacterized protein B0H18DRAFT_1110628 [Neoantrodia serialis]KAH9910740.1 hypothetical protein B0H18DRAFT_1110628 [Neoantrodia serialis]